MKARFNSHEDFLKALADLSGIVRSNGIRSKSRQLSMASQVVDALNGRMSNVNMNMPAGIENPAPRTMTAARAQAQTYDQAENDVTAGFAQTAVEGNLALVVDNSGRDLPGGEDDAETGATRKSKRPHLRLLKPNHDEGTARTEVWHGAEEAHWLRNPVIFMGLCLVVMVMLILFW